MLRHRLSFWGLLALLLVSGQLLFQQAHGMETKSQSSEQFIFMPLVVRPSVDLQVSKLIVTQAIQTDSNSVPLVAQKPTVVRVFAKAVAGESPSNVVVSLSATRNGNSLGAALTSSPTTIPAAPTRDDYASTFNFTLPANWLSDNVVLTAKVDATNVLPEGNESNNTYAMPVTFNNVPNLQVKILPINYTHQGPTNPGYYPGQAVDYISDWIERAFPVGDVEITYHAPVNFTGDLETNANDAWFALLQKTYALKISELGGEVPADNSPIFYHSLVPTSAGSTRWFYGGIAGVGYIGYREAVALNLGPGDNSGILSGHEIGHNLGRRHAPCGNVAGADADYPYSGAQIGQYGLDIGSTIQFWKPTQAVDFMSYCSPEWVSDYNYVAMYQDQVANGRPLSRPATNSLVIRALFDDQMQATFSPAYEFVTIPDLPDTSSGYVVELLGDEGEVVLRYPVALRHFEEEGIEGYSLATAVPLPVPATAVTHIRLVHEDTFVAERALTLPSANRATAVTLQESATAVTLNWNSPDSSAIIRYTNDDGQTYTTFGVDVTGGQLVVEKQYLDDETGYFELLLADTVQSTPIISYLSK